MLDRVRDQGEGGKFIVGREGVGNALGLDWFQVRP